MVGATPHVGIAAKVGIGLASITIVVSTLVALFFLQSMNEAAESGHRDKAQLLVQVLEADATKSGTVSIARLQELLDSLRKTNPEVIHNEKRIAWRTTVVTSSWRYCQIPPPNRHARYGDAFLRNWKRPCCYPQGWRGKSKQAVALPLSLKMEERLRTYCAWPMPECTKIN